MTVEMANEWNRAVRDGMFAPPTGPCADCRSDDLPLLWSGRCRYCSDLACLGIGLDPDAPDDPVSVPSQTRHWGAGCRDSWWRQFIDFERECWRQFRLQRAAR